MRSANMEVLAVLGVLASLLIIGGQAVCDNTGGWSKPLYDMWVNHINMVVKAEAVYLYKTGTTEDHIETLKKFKKLAKKFMDANLAEPEFTNDCFSMITKLPVASTPAWIYLITDNEPLNHNYAARFRILETTIKEAIKAHMTQGENNQGFVLPVEELCEEIPSRLFQKEISIKDACSDVDTCSLDPYPYGRQTGNWPPYNVFDRVCTSDNKCNMEVANQLMSGLSWQAISDWMVEKICPNDCTGGTCNVDKTFEKVLHESELLMAYLYADPNTWQSTWKSFFEDALDNDAFLDVKESVAMIDEKVNLFETTLKACNEILFTKACPYADIYKEYILIKKIQNYRKDPGLVRDFRHFPNIDFQRRLMQEKDTLRHLKLLGAIKNVDENLEASVSGISNYFKNLAEYDEGIADADVAFIQGELTRFEQNMTDVENQVKDSLKKLLKQTEILTGANVAEKAALLALKMTENSNPLKLLVSSPDLKEIAELSGEIANAATDVVKASALLRNFDALVQDSLKITEAFYKNKEQLKGLKEIVAKIRENATNDIGKDADVFLEAYAGYTPQTDRSALETNNALWSAFSGAACDLLSGDVGIGGAVIKSDVAKQLLCEKFEGTLAQFFTLREDIFDFQFQLVDAVAAAVRGNIAKRFSEGIEAEGVKLHASQLLIGSFKMHNKFQSTASLACDVLEYQLQGEQDTRACATTNGLFTDQNLDALIERSFTASTTYVQKDVYIPTWPSFEGDTGYIDLQAMAEGQTIVFKLPTNRTWLIENGWITSQYTNMPFVKEIELFLPQKEYKTGAERQETTTTITLSSIAGSRVSLSTSKKNIAYILPPRHRIFTTEYKEGYTTCSATEIDNPYSLCGNLPKICRLATSSRGSLILYPTILSTWRLSHVIEQGIKQFQWNAPKPASNLLIHARVKLIPSIQPQKDAPKIAKRSELVLSTNGCCDGNMYRISRFNNSCAQCPVKSQSKLRGYYCELNEEEVPSGSGSGQEDDEEAEDSTSQL